MQVTVVQLPDELFRQGSVLIDTWFIERGQSFFVGQPLAILRVGNALLTVRADAPGLMMEYEPQRVAPGTRLYTYRSVTAFELFRWQNPASTVLPEENQLVEVRAPALGESVVEYQVREWIVNPGTPVQREQPLFTAETDKIDVEIPAPASGFLVETFTPAGTVVRPGDLVARISTNAIDDIDAAVQSEPTTKVVQTAPLAIPSSTTTHRRELPQPFDPPTTTARTFDALVLGGSFEGLTLATALSSAGWSVAVIEAQSIEERVALGSWDRFFSALLAESAPSGLSFDAMPSTIERALHRCREELSRQQNDALLAGVHWFEDDCKRLSTGELFCKELNAPLQARRAVIIAATPIPSQPKRSALQLATPAALLSSEQTSIAVMGTNAYALALAAHLRRWFRASFWTEHSYWFALPKLFRTQSMSVTHSMQSLETAVRYGTSVELLNEQGTVVSQAASVFVFPTQWTLPYETQLHTNEAGLLSTDSMQRCSSEQVFAVGACTGAFSFSESEQQVRRLRAHLLQEQVPALAHHSTILWTPSPQVHWSSGARSPALVLCGYAAVGGAPQLTTLQLEADPQTHTFLAAHAHGPHAVDAMQLLSMLFEQNTTIDQLASVVSSDALLSSWSMLANDLLGKTPAQSLLSSGFGNP